MIKELKVKNFKIVGDDLSKTLMLKGTGKILNVFINFGEVTPLIKLKMITKIGEVILDINNIGKQETEIYYPRLNASGEREHEAVMPKEVESSSEYYYFKDILFLKVEKDNLKEEGVLIKELIVLIEE